MKQNDKIALKQNFVKMDENYAYPPWQSVNNRKK